MSPARPTAAAAAKLDPAWAHRRMLLTAGDRLSTRQLHRLQHLFDHDDPTDEIGAAWAVKELLRQLLAERDPDRIRHRLWRYYDAAARVDMAETSRLATTIETWWPPILVLLDLGVTNARTEAFNRIIKLSRVKKLAGIWDADGWGSSGRPRRWSRRRGQVVPEWPLGRVDRGSSRPSACARSMDSPVQGRWSAPLDDPPAKRAA